MDITSVDNQQVKKIVALHNKKYRDEYNEFFIEGAKLLEEAIRYNQDIVKVFYCPKITDYSFNIPAVTVSKEVISKMAATNTPQGIVAVLKIPKSNILRNEKVLFLDRVQDPGNVGTIIRTADAFGFDAILLSEGCADVYSPKVVRSTMGSIFHLPIKQKVSVSEIKKMGNKIYASSLEANTSILDINISMPFVLVIGNEGQGISSEIKEVSDNFVKIDMQGNAESLNASIAAGILMYEFSKMKK